MINENQAAVYKKPTSNKSIQVGKKEKKNIYHANTNEKKAGMAMPVSDKAVFRAKKTTRDKRNINEKQGQVTKKTQQT